MHQNEENIEKTLRLDLGRILMYFYSGSTVFRVYRLSQANLMFH